MRTAMLTQGLLSKAIELAWWDGAYRGALLALVAVAVVQLAFLVARSR